VKLLANQSLVIIHTDERR